MVQIECNRTGQFREGILEDAGEDEERKAGKRTRRGGTEFRRKGSGSEGGGQ